MKANWLSLLILILLISAVGIIAQGDLPAASELDDGLNYLTIDGATCARGTPYRFAARNADPSKLMIYFQGGGGCWNFSTCRVGGTFDDSANEGELSEYGGLFDFDNPENPVVDYSVVVVLYCTGDVHTGAASASFGEGDGAVNIGFNGVANTNAVLEWTYENYPDPEKLIVTGSSAGAYGAIYHAPGILEHYADIDAVVLGDAGIGVTQEGWAGTEVWNIAANIPMIEGFGEVSEATFTTDLYRNSATLFTNARFAEYTSAADQVQIGFYFLMGGAPLDWLRIMQERLESLGQVENFHSYIGWGDSHTILASPLFYTMQTNGVRFLDWFNALLNGDPVESVKCEDCTAEEFYQP